MQAMIASQQQLIRCMNMTSSSPPRSENESHYENTDGSQDGSHGGGDFDRLRPKKATSSSWLNLLTPSYKSRLEEFRRTFSNSIPPNEKLVVDYSSALQKEILVHGRLYVSLNYMCFYANIFSWETTLLIKNTDIASMIKTNTARVIPNAIQITTNDGDKYIFTSFVTRDKAFMMMFRIWQNSLLHLPTSSSDLWKWIRDNYGDDLGFTPEEEETLNIKQCEELELQDLSNRHNSCDTDSSSSDELEKAPIPASGPAKCSCEKHEGKLVMSEVYNYQVDVLFSMIFQDGLFNRKLIHYRKTAILKSSSWKLTNSEKGSQKLSRTLLLKVPIRNPLYKNVETRDTQTILNSSPGENYSIKSEGLSSGVPYSDKFIVRTIWCFTRAEDPHKTRIVGHTSIVFTKSSWGLGLVKPFIEKNSFEGVEDYCTDLDVFLKKWETEPVTGVIESNLSNNNIEEEEELMESVHGENIAAGSASNVFYERRKQSGTINMEDTSLLKIILILLLALFILNLFFYYRLWQLEAAARDYDNFIPSMKESKTNLPLSEALQKWRRVLGHAVHLIELMEKNLMDLKNNVKAGDEL